MTPKQYEICVCQDSLKISENASTKKDCRHEALSTWSIRRFQNVSKSLVGRSIITVTLLNISRIFCCSSTEISTNDCESLGSITNGLSGKQKRLIVRLQKCLVQSYYPNARTAPRWPRNTAIYGHKIGQMLGTVVVNNGLQIRQPPKFCLPYAIDSPGGTWLKIRRGCALQQIFFDTGRQKVHYTTLE